MLKDRAQKALALKFCISKRWLPQLEVNIESSKRLEKQNLLLTDLDVLAVALSPVGEQVKFIFDCKSGNRESPIGRVFWLKGVMEKTHSSHGFILMNSKMNIGKDHRLTAADLNISLLKENEFESLSIGTGGSTSINTEYSVAADITAWEKLSELNKKYPNMSEYLSFSNSSFWMINEPGEQCRKVVAKLRRIRSELDPSKNEHLCIFGDALSLFLMTISNIANKLLLVLISPTEKDDFSSLVLAYLYGGYENLNAAIKIRSLATGQNEGDALSIFPETNKFEHLTREIMQAPQQAMAAALLARELSLCMLTNSEQTKLQLDIANENPYATKFILLASEYLQQAIKLPPEFFDIYSKISFGITTKNSKRKK